MLPISLDLPDTREKWLRLLSQVAHVEDIAEHPRYQEFLHGGTCIRDKPTHINDSNSSLNPHGRNPKKHVQANGYFEAIYQGYLMKQPPKRKGIPTVVRNQNAPRFHWRYFQLHAHVLDYFE